jgi:hypothetical protein
LEDSYQLSRVAQFLALARGDESFPKHVLLKEFGNIQPPDFSMIELENTAYSVLADLNLPIYITTNYDLFMETALRAKGKSPISEFCRWNSDLKHGLESFGIQSVFDRRSKYTPTPDKPLVYHLYGLYRLSREYRLDGQDIDLPQSLVLTEEDYTDFARAMNKETVESILPTVVSRALAISSLLFIGYSLDDLGFRTLFQGVLSSRPGLGGTNIAVHLPPSNNSDRARGYLDRYTRRMFGADVYWGNASEFSAELRKRLDKFRHAIP